MKRRAFAIIEMLSILVLLAAFAVVATRLFTSTIKLSHNYGESQNTINSTGFAIATLRNDIAAAKDFKSPDASTLQLTTADDQSITWTVKDDQLVRTAGNDHHQWRAPSPGATFATDATTVILKFKDPDFGELWMSNQKRVIEKLRH